MVLIVVGSFGFGLLGPDGRRGYGIAILATLILQIGLGIANVLQQWPLLLAVAHNTGAALLLCATLVATARVFIVQTVPGTLRRAEFPRRFHVVR